MGAMSPLAYRPWEESPALHAEPHRALAPHIDRENAIMADFILWGFDASTYVRTVKMLLAEKNFTAFKQVPLNVLAGDPRKPEHLERHPFGKVPVLDHNG